MSLKIMVSQLHLAFSCQFIKPLIQLQDPPEVLEIQTQKEHSLCSLESMRRGGHVN